MNELKNVLQFIAIITICYIIYIAYKYLKTILKKNRITKFSINFNKKDKPDSLIFSLIFKISDILSSLVIFNGISRTYNEYIDEDSRLKKGIDYISIKILLGIFLIIIYLIITFLYKQEINTTILILNFILGYVLPDFYCLYISNKNKKITYNSLLNSIIIMNNSYNIGRSTEQALKDIIDRSNGYVKKEFSKVLSDIKLGISPSLAFKKMYERTRIKEILEISNLLSSINKSGISSSEVFSNMEHKLIEQEKFKEEIKSLHSINLLSFLIFTLLPLLFIIYIMFFKLDLSMLFLNNIGVYIFLILFILYLLYCFIIWKIVKGE